jgi:ubiquinone/menaquinone biosynthesis C-methylase UbiE
MDTIKKIFRADHARQYDQKAIELKWLDPAIVFGLTYRFVKPGDRLLDVGIGTGLSSELFHKAGLRIYGIDFSPEMLSRCQSKQMTVDLKEHDLSDTPYPYPSNSMDHAVCTGVTHLFKDMSPIFHELARILKNNGTFAFIVADCEDTEKRVKMIKPRHHPHARKVPIYCYSEAHIQKLLDRYGFEQVYDLQFWASTIGNRPGRYKAYVLRKPISMDNTPEL